VNDSAQYYMLGYYLDRTKTKAGWRKLAVKVKREHIEVRARSGFFVTNATVDPESSRNGDLSSALQSPLDYTSLALTAHWDKIEAGKEPGKKHVHYQMLVAPAPPLVDESADNHVVLEFVTLAKTAEGKQVDRPWGPEAGTAFDRGKAGLVEEDWTTLQWRPRSCSGRILGTFRSARRSERARGLGGGSVEGRMKVWFQGPECAILF
jgi:hypothetical protein